MRCSVLGRRLREAVGGAGGAQSDSDGFGPTSAQGVICPQSFSYTLSHCSHCGLRTSALTKACIWQTLVRKCLGDHTEMLFVRVSRSVACAPCSAWSSFNFCHRRKKQHGTWPLACQSLKDLNSYFI